MSDDKGEGGYGYPWRRSKDSDSHVEIDHPTQWMWRRKEQMGPWKSEGIHASRRRREKGTRQVRRENHGVSSHCQDGLEYMNS